MTCVAVATSPVLAPCHSPSMRHRDDPGIFGDVRPSHSFDSLPSSPLLYAGPKQSPYVSSRKTSPSHSAMPPPSPRVQCSPRTPSSWISPIGSPSVRSICVCGGVAVHALCSCSGVPSPVLSDIKWRPSSLEKRFNNLEAQHPDLKYGSSPVSNMEPPSPRPSSSPISRFLPAEAPSPRFGGAHPAFASPRVFSRPASANSNHYQPSVLLDRCEPRVGANGSASGPSFPVPRSSAAVELPQLDLRKGRVDAAAKIEPLSASASVSTAGVPTTGVAAGLAGRHLSPPLKRKVPPRLEIPTGIPSTFPHVVDLGEDAVHEMTVDGSYYGIACKKGRREVLEDAHRVVTDLNGDPGQAFFGVFDGHGGRKAANFAAENLVHKITEAIDNSPEGKGSVEAAVRAGYLATDAEFLSQRVTSGASCVTALMKDGYMVVANAGDCRAVLSRAGTAEALTRDHQAGREDERQRIEMLGGFVDNFTGIWRVQGTLAVSRGIGDLHLKEWISAEPEVQRLPITPDCEFLILASDGLWDAFTNQEAVDTARAVLQLERMDFDTRSLSSLSKGGAEEQSVDPEKCLALSTANDSEINTCMGTMKADVGFPEPALSSAGPAIACKKLVELSANRGSRDDISVVIVDLQHFQRNAGFVSGSS